MANTRRLIELALKGLEAERIRIDGEMKDLQGQLKGQPAEAGGAARGRRRRTGVRRSNLTDAGRKKLSDMMKRRWAERRKALKAGK